MLSGTATPAPASATAPDSGQPAPILTALPNLNDILPAGTKITGTPTEVYTRVARGVLTCWFGASGPLKSTHMYHAEAEPASKGGRSEIEIFVKDPSASDPRSMRAYRILVAPGEGVPKLEIENLKVPEPLATRFKNDVYRWAADDAGCEDNPVTTGWSASPAPDKAEKGRGKTARKQ